MGRYQESFNIFYFNDLKTLIKRKYFLFVILKMLMLKGFFRQSKANGEKDKV